VPRDQAIAPAACVALLTREYPAEVSGGAPAVQVTYLARELARWSISRAMPGRRTARRRSRTGLGLMAEHQALQVVSTDLSMALL